MSRWLSDIAPFAFVGGLFLVIRWSIGRWERRARIQYGPCIPAPVTKRVRASLCRRAVVYALEGWHKLRRDWPVPPEDGERFTEPEVRLMHDIWTAWDSGETAPEHYYPGITRDAEDL